MTVDVELARKLAKYYALKFISDMLHELQELLERHFEVRSTDTFVIAAVIHSLKYELRDELQSRGLREDEIERLLGD